MLVPNHNVPLPQCLVSARDKAAAPISCEPCSAGLRCSLRELEKGQYLFFQGDSQTYVYRVQTGGLVAFLSLASGRRQVVDFALPGDLIGFGSDHQFQFTAQAIARTELRCIPRDELKRRSLEDPRLAWTLYEASVSQLHDTYEQLLTTGQRAPEEKLAAFLVAMARRNARHGGDPAIIPLPMMRTDIADYLGLTSETISRTFTHFRTKKLIEIRSYRRIRLIQPERLAQLASGMRLPQTRIGLLQAGHSANERELN
ncbi:helix-turn-helix domain-containing protein [Bradyrhizobium sp.]|uniref:helix-turn-helix domain-containing protein n=1 Tax=Bradyrhizobium sp. TaxID=376 RepID=UPI001D5ADAC5|nr:helix-turn-helix domain-containing protein [Bradyrhizobium sp.]MBI5320041.1 helix-turn-helix domain-containing protein [Bradyrhizobium sp.]